MRGRTCGGMLVVAIVLAPGALAEPTDGPPVPDVLWFGTPSVVWADWSNFTTALPAGDGYVQQPVSHYDRGTWIWFTSAMPADWHLAAGTELRLVVTLSGMERTWPVPVPVGDDDEPFATLFEGEAYARGRDGGVTFSTGSATVPMDPVHPPEGPIQVSIPMVVKEGLVVPEGDRFEARLHVYARGVKHNSMRVHIGGEDTASHIVVPGFPVAAFRAWEEAYPHDVCLYQRAQDEPCPDARLSGPRPAPVAQETPGAQAEAPALPAVVLVAAMALLARRGRRLLAP